MISVSLQLYVLLWIIWTSHVFTLFLEYFGRFNKVSEYVFKISFFMRIFINILFLLALFSFNIH